MDVTEAIDQIITGVFRLALLDGDNADRRLECAQWLTEGVQRVFYARNWSWRRSVVDPFTLVSGAKPLPVNFQSINVRRRGGVWFKTTGARLDPLPEEEMRDLLLAPGGAPSGNPSYYSIYGQDPTTAKAILHCDTTANSPLVLAFETAPPDLDEGTGIDNLVLAIPAHYHQSAIIPIVRAYARKRNGDADADPEAEINKAIALIARAELPDGDGPKQMPNVFGEGYGG